MALKSGHIIRVGEFLSTSDYIQSSNLAYFAIMQEDGNFCVYQGTGPDDVYRNLLWCSKILATGGKFYAIMQEDGNFCVYKGTGPDDKGEYVWCSMALATGGKFFAYMQTDGNFCVYKGTGPDDGQGFVWGTLIVDPDPIVDVAEISSIAYDLGAAQILDSSPADLFSQKVKNIMPNPQTSTISGSASVSETSGWSDALGAKIGVQTSFKCGVPVLAEGKVQVDVQVSNTYTWSGSQTRTKTWGFDTALTVDPGQQGLVLVSATLSTIVVPYTLTGTVICKSGKRRLGQIKGQYTGTNSHDLTVTFQPLASGTLEPMESRALPVKATTTYAAAS